MRAIVWSLAVLIGLIGLPASATTFVMMSDESLVDQAPIIVQARVVSRDYAPTLGMPSTDYMIEVDRVLKGDVPGSGLVIRVPGGLRSDGMGLAVFGAPELEVGEGALLFLSPSQDGTFRVVHLMLGAFHEVPFQGRQLAVRVFGEAREVVLPDSTATQGDEGRLRGPRKLEAFAEWISDRVGGEKRRADYFLKDSEITGGLQNQIDRFTLFKSRRSSLNMRWFFEGPVTWEIHSSGQPGLTLQQIQTAVRNGINAWNGVPGVDVRYRLGGMTTASGGLTTADGVNTVQFEDPNNNTDLFGAAFTCTGGGVLAIGGPWHTEGTFPFQGRQVHRILQADIVTNKGLECFFKASQNPQLTADELFAHELGHTLGIGHSCGDGLSGSCDTEAKNEALMRATVHDDRRGARLNDDDRAAVRSLYGTGVFGDPPVAPSNLRGVVLTSTSVRLSWSDNSDNETSFQIQLMKNEEPFSVVVDALAADNTRVTIAGLMPETVYTFRMRARNSAGFSGFSNTVTLVTLPSVPDTPSDLRAVQVSPTQVLLAWKDNSDDELDFSIEMSSPTMDFDPRAVAGAGTEQITISGLLRNTPYTFRVRARNDIGFSPYSNEASASTAVLDPGEPPCVGDDRTLCLLDGRYRVRAQWRNQRSPGSNGIGHAVVVPGSDQSGTFWFFDPANVELIVKMIDGTSLNNFYWTFYGALSDVEYWITVLDTTTGENVTYHNPPREICGLGDVRSFPRLDDPVPAPQGGGAGSALRIGSLGWSKALTNRAALDSMAAAGTEIGTCEPGPTTVCLLGNRFRVQVEWANPRAPFNDGPGNRRVVSTVPSDNTGFFWFFAPNNIELVVKVLDARTFSGHFWFFYGALSDVAYRITVTDTIGGETRTYENSPFNLCGDADVMAF